MKGMLPMDWGKAGLLMGALGGRRAVGLWGAVGGGCRASGINRGSCKHMITLLHITMVTMMIMIITTLSGIG